MNKRTSIFMMAVISIFVSCGIAMAGDVYVDANAANPVSPFASWADATPDINLGVAQLSSGETCWVKDGTYTITATLSINANETIRSMNGRDVTIVNGGGAAVNKRAFFSSSWSHC